MSDSTKAPSSLLYRWDLDKTYLRTEFDTLRDLLRTAFEPAARKQTVPGAAALLRELCSSRAAAIHILSGSPEQMRKVLEAKLRLDGITWDSFTLKPSLHHLVRGRFRFLRDQIGYKLGALLASRIEVPSEIDEILFGDDAEADALIYSLYADLCAGRAGEDTLVAVARLARVYDDQRERLLELYRSLEKRDAVRRVFIHLDRISSPRDFEGFGPLICPFYNYFQPALVLAERGVLSGAAALRVGAEMMAHDDFDAEGLFASFMDLVQRGHIGESAARILCETWSRGAAEELGRVAPSLSEFVESIDKEATTLAAAVDFAATSNLDYASLFSRDVARAHAARRRVVGRAGRRR